MSPVSIPPFPEKARETGSARGWTPLDGLIFRGMRCERGFTLLEVMIAMAVLAIALVAVFQLQSQSVSMLATSRFETTAAFLAKGRMAELEAANTRELRSGSGDFGSDHADYSWETIIESTPLDALVKVTVLVTNTAMTRNNTFRLVLYRTVTPG